MKRKLLIKLNILALFAASILFNVSDAQAQNWNEIVKSVASDREAGDYYGENLAISGDYAIVGAYIEDHDANGANTMTSSGSAYILKKDQGGTDNWGQVAKLVASDRGGSDLFGFRVAISGDYAVVAALGEDHDTSGANYASRSGSAYIFKKDQGGTDNWGEVKKIVASITGEK